MLSRQAKLSQTIPQLELNEYPRVSIVVPVYNHERYVIECLDSILGTAYPNLELIVINDCSRDASHTVVQDWIQAHAEQRITYVNHQQNMGLTKTLNEAIALATGEFFCLIAGDDVMLPNGIADRLSYLISRPDKLAVFADCHVIDLNGKLLHESGITGLYKHTGLRKDLLAIDKLMPYNIVFHWGVPGPVFMCRKETFQIVGPYDEHLSVEDWDMYLRITAIGALGYYDTYVAQYRIHQDNYSTSQAKKVSIGFANTANKNSNLFQWTNNTRLRLQYLSWKLKSIDNVFQKSLYVIYINLLLFVTNRAYLAQRRRIVSKINTVK